MLDAAKSAAKMQAINEAFLAIGGDGDTKMPRSSVPAEAIAWEYHVASHLARVAEARRKRALANAVRAGILFDPEKQPLPVGSHALVYGGDVVEITVDVTAPTSKFDQAAFVHDLEKAGVAVRLINRLAARHTHDNRAPHRFTSSLVTKEAAAGLAHAT